MFPLVWAFIGGIRGVLVAAATASAVLGAAHVYNTMFDNPAVVREARAGFVLQAERDALLAQVAEMRRQRDAADRAHADFLTWVDQIERDAEARTEQLEKEIDEYEQKLAEDGRACYLNRADIEWLLRN